MEGVDILYSQLAEQMVMLEAMYSGLSDQLTKEELQEKLHTAALSSLENLIAEQILRTKIDEYGLTLTQEEQSAAEAVWEQTLASMTQSVQSTYPDLEGDDPGRHGPDRSGGQRPAGGDRGGQRRPVRPGK